MCGQKRKTMGVIRKTVTYHVFDQLPINNNKAKSSSPKYLILFALLLLY